MNAPPLPWASTAPEAPLEPPAIRAGQKIEVLWQLIDDEEGDGAAAASTATEGQAEASQKKKEPRRVWWGATIESVEGGKNNDGVASASAPPLRATIRYEAAHGFESETALVEFAPSTSEEEEEERTLRNVGADGVAVADEQALAWRFLGEIEEGEGEEEEEEEDVDFEIEAAAAATPGEVVTASDLEKALSAQIGSLESAIGVSATAAASAALLARAGGSVAAANEVASRFESFAGVLRDKLAAAARANGGAALGEEEVRAAVAAARQGSGGGGGGGAS